MEQRVNNNCNSRLCGNDLRIENSQLLSQRDGLPFIIGTVHSAACLKRLAKRPQEIFQEIDLLEARLDSLPYKLLPSEWPLPVIATARHPAEGGAENLTLGERRRLLEESLPWALGIDVELRSANQFTSTIAHAKKQKRFVICSFHDFQTVPSLARLERMAFSAQEAGADLFKVACEIRSEEELLRLLAFQSMPSAELPIATMGMGEGGKLSRLLLPLLGSVLSYGWLYQPQVEGQWSARDISRHLHFLRKIETS
ncbi:MAG: type I 3-dehydroquinate dehydratase [Chthoniobacterales bacterium]